VIFLEFLVFFFWVFWTYFFLKGDKREDQFFHDIDRIELTTGPMRESSSSTSDTLPTDDDDPDDLTRVQPVRNERQYLRDYEEKENIRDYEKYEDLIDRYDLGSSGSSGPSGSYVNQNWEWLRWKEDSRGKLGLKKREYPPPYRSRKQLKKMHDQWREMESHYSMVRIETEEMAENEWWDLLIIERKRLKILLEREEEDSEPLEGRTWKEIQEKLDELKYSEKK